MIVHPGARQNDRRENVIWMAKQRDMRMVGQTDGQMDRWRVRGADGKIGAGMGSRFEQGSQF